MLRYVFRALVAITLLIMYLARYSGGRMNPYEFLPFYYWFVVSVFVFGAFGVYSVVKALKDPRNRRAYLLDILLAVSWVPYWLAMLH
jgi:bacteriorhodopsin